VYTLKVTAITTKAAASPTDTYVLLFADVSGNVKTSAGVVTSSVGDVLTLTPTGGTAFTVTVTGDGITGIAGNIAFTDNSSISAPGSVNPLANGEIEMTDAAITKDRTLGVPGMAINYVYNGANLLAVNSGATLTVLPGTTIRFTQTDGGLTITDGAMAKMFGIDKLFVLDATGKLTDTPSANSGHVTLKASGSGDNKWRGLLIESTLANELNYVDITNAGNGPNGEDAAVFLHDAKLAMRNCVIDGSKSNGILLWDHSTSRGNTVYLSEFTGNTIKNSAKAPIYTYDYCGLYPLRSLGTGNTFSGNAKEYIHVKFGNTDLHGNMTLHNVGEPWYFNGGIFFINSNCTFTIEPGTTILMGSEAEIRTERDSWINAVGTSVAHIIIKGLEETAGYWNSIQVYSQTPGSKLNYCDISGGGGGYDGNSNWRGLLYMFAESNNEKPNTYVELNNTTFSKSQKYGIYLNQYNASYKCVVSTTDASTITFGACATANIALNIGTTLNSYTTLANAISAIGQ